jgi:DNA-binding NtrC family response regulator
VKSSAPAPTTNARRGIASALRSSAAASNHGVCGIALLIEDDSATAQSIELMLKSESFNVYTTDLGEEAVDLGKLYDYDIILLDLNLPDMSGFEVLRSLFERRTPLTRPPNANNIQYYPRKMRQLQIEIRSER